MFVYMFENLGIRHEGHIREIRDAERSKFCSNCTVLMLASVNMSGTGNHTRSMYVNVDIHLNVIVFCYYPSIYVYMQSVNICSVCIYSVYTDNMCVYMRIYIYMYMAMRRNPVPEDPRQHPSATKV